MLIMKRLYEKSLLHSRFRIIKIKKYLFKNKFKELVPTYFIKLYNILVFNFYLNKLNILLYIYKKKKKISTIELFLLMIFLEYIMKYHINTLYIYIIIKCKLIDINHFGWSSITCKTQ